MVGIVTRLAQLATLADRPRRAGLARWPGPEVRIVAAGGDAGGRSRHGRATASWTRRSPLPTSGDGAIVLGDLGSAVLTARARARGARAERLTSGSSTRRSWRARSPRPWPPRPGCRSTRSSPPRRRRVPVPASSETARRAAGRRRPARPAGGALRPRGDAVRRRHRASPRTTARPMPRASSRCSRWAPRAAATLRLAPTATTPTARSTTLAGCVETRSSRERRSPSAAATVVDRARVPAPRATARSRPRERSERIQPRTAPTRAAPTLSSSTPRPTSSGEPRPGRRRPRRRPRRITRAPAAARDGRGHRGAARAGGGRGPRRRRSGRCPGRSASRSLVPMLRKSASAAIAGAAATAAGVSIIAPSDGASAPGTAASARAIAACTART